MKPLFFLLLFLLGSCETRSSFFPRMPWQDISGRDNGIPTTRYPLYRAKIPESWIRQDPSMSESIADTTKALCEFHLLENEDMIRIVVHNFPANTQTQKVPPSAQVQRWKRQFEELDPTLTSITSCAHGGFAGLYLEGEGILHGKSAKILGWSMQLAPEYDQKLGLEDSFHANQKRADYTIKVLGPPALVTKHQKAITIFANSFELIEELPSPL